MTPPQQPPEADGRLEAAISTTMVQTLHRFTGRGPTRARTTISEDLIVCVLSATLTTAERNLVAHGEAVLVMRARQAYQDMMRPGLVASVEDLTGRNVSAFMSTNHIDPDLAAEIFVLLPRAA
jgi:uncharacterized protein YbcI